MPVRRVRHVFAFAMVVAALALLPSAARAHAEECASGGGFSPSADLFAKFAESEGCMSAAAVSGLDDSRAQLAPGAATGTPNLAHLSNTPKPAPFETEADFNSDLAFENGYAFQGNYDGVQIYDVRQPDRPALAAFIHCLGSQNDVTVNDGILVTRRTRSATRPSARATSRCRRRARSTASRPTGRACGSSTSATRTARSTSAPCAPTAARTPIRCCPRPAGCSST